MSCKSIGTSIFTFFSKNYRDDSALPKALSLIPLIGMFVCLHKNASIVEAFLAAKKENNLSRMLEIIKLDKQYELCGIGRSLISQAVATTLVVLNIFSSPTVIICGAFNGFFIFKARREIQLLDKQIDILEKKLMTSTEEPEKKMEAEPASDLRQKTA